MRGRQDFAKESVISSSDCISKSFPLLSHDRCSWACNHRQLWTDQAVDNVCVIPRNRAGKQTARRHQKNVSPADRPSLCSGVWLENSATLWCRIFAHRPQRNRAAQVCGSCLETSASCSQSCSCSMSMVNYDHEQGASSRHYDSTL